MELHPAFLGMMQKKRFPIAFFLSVSVILGVATPGCKTVCNEESFSRPFEEEKVAQLAHESYRVAWDANRWARRDLRIGPFHASRFYPSRLDREVVLYLDRLSRQAPWIAFEIEKHPRAPRCTSKQAYDIVALDAVMLKARLCPDSFQPSTVVKIERLLHMIDEISSYYEVKESGVGVASK